METAEDYLRKLKDPQKPRSREQFFCTNAFGVAPNAGIDVIDVMGFPFSGSLSSSIWFEATKGSVAGKPLWSIVGHQAVKDSGSRIDFIVTCYDMKKDFALSRREAERRLIELEHAMQSARLLKPSSKDMQGNLAFDPVLPALHH